MERLVKRCGNNPAVPTGFDLDFIFELDNKENEGLQTVFDRLCELEEKIEKGELLEVVRCKDCKAFVRNEGVDPNLGDCYRYGIGCIRIMSIDDFCSKGERREGE